MSYIEVLNIEDKIKLARNNYVNRNVKHIDVLDINEKIKLAALSKFTSNYKLSGGAEDYDQSFKRDCPGFPLIKSVYPACKRIVAIGDMHGDYDLMINSLKLANLIDDNLNWSGEKDTIVVQLGDQIDRCRPNVYSCDNKLATYNDEASDIKIMKFFTNLNDQALKSGSRVISLLGNHEVMNSCGKLNYVSYLGLKEFENYKDPTKNVTFKNGKEGRAHAFKPGNEIGNFMACTRVSAVIVGNWLFVHAAVLPALIDYFKISDISGLSDINTLIRRWLLGHVNYTDVKDILNSDKISPFWPRLFGNIKPNVNTDEKCKQDVNCNLDLKKCNDYLDPVLETFRINGMIVGHTPQYYTHNEGINSTCNNKLWRADIGSSKAFVSLDKNSKRRIQVLEITDDKNSKVLSN